MFKHTTLKRLGSGVVCFALLIAMVVTSCASPTATPVPTATKPPVAQATATSAPTPTAAPTATKAATATPVPSGNITTIRVSNPMVANTAHGKALQDWAKLVLERSKGQVVIQNFWSSELGTQAAGFEAVRAGTLDVVLGTTGIAASVVKEFNAVGATYLWDSMDQFYRVLNDPIMDELNKKLEPSGAVAIGAVLAGWKNLWNVKRPVRTPEDLKGLKLYVVNAKDAIGLFQAAGAQPVNLVFAEMYENMRTGVADGTDESSGILASSKFYEVAKFYTPLKYYLTISFMYGSTKRAAAWPAGVKDMVFQAAKETFANSAKYEGELYQQGLDNLKKNGVTVTEPDMAAFKALAEKEAWPKSRESAGAEFFDRFMQIAAKYK